MSKLINTSLKKNANTHIQNAQVGWQTKPKHVFAYIEGVGLPLYINQVVQTTKLQSTDTHCFISACVMNLSLQPLKDRVPHGFKTWGSPLPKAPTL